MSEHARSKGKRFPTLKTDEEAEEWLSTADLSEYDFSGFRLIGEFFEFLSEQARVKTGLAERQLVPRTSAKKRAD